VKSRGLPSLGSLSHHEGPCTPCQFQCFGNAPCKNGIECTLCHCLSLIILAFLITSCSNNSAMKPEDFKNKEPRLIIEEYLSGNVKAWGVLQNRSGKVTRQFSADLDGTWDGKQLILKEKFNWDDGEVQDREWTITKIDEHNYEGTAGDVVGKAIGYSYGPAFKFEYVLLVPVKGKELKITFDDWIFKQDERVAINRATMTKFGFKVAELTVVFVKD
jgi:hypothetical protein